MRSLILINGLRWAIKLVPANSFTLVKENDEGYALGACDIRNQTIFINETLNPKMMERVLCHELTHATLYSYDVILTEEQEELFADLLATYGQEIINNSKI